jgi:high-affinity K+ transport system ATPase subunit B
MVILTDKMLDLIAQYQRLKTQYHIAWMIFLFYLSFIDVWSLCICNR